MKKASIAFCCLGLPLFAACSKPSSNTIRIQNENGEIVEVDREMLEDSVEAFDGVLDGIDMSDGLSESERRAIEQRQQDAAEQLIEKWQNE